MTAEQLHHFVVVAEELNYHHAGRRLGIAPSPLSQSIVRLELALGLVLFERSRRSVRLTAAGQAFLPRAQAIGSQIAAAALLVGPHREPAGALRLGIPRGGLGGLTMRLLREVERRRPEHPVRLVEAASEHFGTMLLDGSLDAAAMHRPSAVPDGLELRTVRSRRLIAAVPAGAPWTSSSSLVLADLAAAPLILFPSATEPFCHGQLMACFQAGRLVPDIRIEEALVPMRLELVAVGLGVTLIPAELEVPVPKRVALRVVTDLPSALRSDVMLAWPKATPMHRGDLFRTIADYLRG